MGKPTMAQWRGWAIPDQDLGCWVIPHYHPSFVQRNPNDVGLANLFRRDLESALEKSQRPFSEYRSMEQITILEKDDDAIQILGRVLERKPDLLAFDFETTGLKPHRAGHDIKYAAICWGEGSFAFQTSNPKIRDLLGQIIAHPDIPIAAHNIQFEDVWSRMILNVEPSGWAWDSQLATHVLDDRSDITSLEFQAAIRYGDWFFKDATNPYLKPPGMVDGRKTGANDVNRIDECPVEDILLRVAKDALYGYWLTLDQMREIHELERPMKRSGTILDAYWLFQDGALAFADTSIEGGLVFSHKYFDEIRTLLVRDMENTEKEILQTEPAKLWQEREDKELNYNSGIQLGKLLFTHYRIEPVKKTEKNNASVDHGVLEALSIHPQVGEFCAMVLDYRKKGKLLGTYIDGFAREADNGIIYPHFGLNIPRSYRSSSNNPNFQNIPARDEWAHHTIRMGLFPHPGNHFMGVDFSAHEVRIAACYSRDAELIRYINDPTRDMHNDQAALIYRLPTDRVPKKLRDVAKGDFVFAQLYGSWFRQCAEHLWANSLDLVLDNGVPVHEHLNRVGVRYYRDFEAHVEAEEARFWRKFSGLDAWRREWIDRYERDGVIPMFHGFRRQGHLTRNKIFNTSIQGTAFHLLLWSFITLNDVRKAEGWESKLIGQIHDDIRWSVAPQELSYVMQMHQWVMTEAIKTPHPWLCVPLEVEFKLTEVDQPWATEEKRRIPAII
jgi:DNA polymerase I-like protein with 3'-5' exonuclease and polymerase domains